MNASVKRIAPLAVLSALLMMSAPDATAQTLGESRRQSTREELEKAVKISEQAAVSAPESRLRARHQAEVTQLRQRLETGDFAAGDRIFISVYGDSVLSDTFTVRVNRVLRLPGIPDVPLHGVLASELETHLTKSLGVYYKDPRVDATPLVRVSVQGAVGRPGFYVVPIDQALPDLIMAAGGPGGTSDLERATVRRGTETILDRRAMQLALRQGKTVGDVSMREGDEIVVPDRQSRFSVQNILGALGALTGVFWAIRWGVRR
jgi:protein involved in polysaccharide export with SLBB domain